MSAEDVAWDLSNFLTENPDYRYPGSPLMSTELDGAYVFDITQEETTYIVTVQEKQ